MVNSALGASLISGTVTCKYDCGKIKNGTITLKIIDSGASVRESKFKIKSNGNFNVKTFSNYKKAKLTIKSANHVQSTIYLDIGTNISNENIRIPGCKAGARQKAADESRKAEERRKAADESRKAEERRKAADESRKAEEKRQNEELRQEIIKKKIEDEELKQQWKKREGRRLAEKDELLRQKIIKKDIEDDIKAGEMRISYEANSSAEIKYKKYLKILFMSSILIFLVVYDTLFSRDSKLIKLKNNYNRIQIRRSRKAEEGRKAQESLKAEARRKAADESRKAEEGKKAQESRKAEERKKAQESRKAEEKRKDDNYNDSQESNKSNKSSEKFETEEIRFGRILGLKGKPNLNEIKKRYRNNIKKYHPDKVAMLGDELIELAEEKTKELNEAYKYFMNIYN